MQLWVAVATQDKEITLVGLAHSSSKAAENLNNLLKKDYKEYCDFGKSPEGLEEEPDDSVTFAEWLQDWNIYEPVEATLKEG